MSTAVMMLSVPPEVTEPHGLCSGSGPRAASPCMRSSAIAVTSPSKRVALGQMSRWSAFTCE
jgi:hypothetical protein